MEEDLSRIEESRAATRRPQPMQKDRADILRALLVADGGKMLLKEFAISYPIQSTISLHS
jgi:hypothetical protein